MIYFFPLVLALLILAIIIIFCMGFRMQELLNEIDKLKETIQELLKKIAELEEALENIPIIQVG